MLVDFTNFVDHLTFHWCISACIGALQGLDHHILPLVHYLFVVVLSISQT